MTKNFEKNPILKKISHLQKFSNLVDI